MEMEKIIKTAYALAAGEITKYGTPKLEHFEISFKKGGELAEQLKANADIVALGTILMDLKLGECWKENKLAEHVQRSSQEAQKCLRPFNLPADVFKKIVSCIESHHGAAEYYCLEAEICANADCYRFLTPVGIFNYLIMLGNRTQDFQECLRQLEYKMEEKYRALSLDICKKELSGYYREFKDLIAKARLGA
jgi:HD superfamily phosphodiesterase